MPVNLEWWSTTWGRLAPGDYVRAPGGSVWLVAAVIDRDAFNDEYQLMQDGRSAWSLHPKDEEVTAARPGFSSIVSVEEVIGLFRMKGFEVDHG